MAELKGQIFSVLLVWQTDAFSSLAWVPKDTTIMHCFLTHDFTTTSAQGRQSAHRLLRQKRFWGRQEDEAAVEHRTQVCRDPNSVILTLKPQRNLHMLPTCKVVRRNWTTLGLVKQLVLLLNSAELDAVLAEVHRWGWGSAELKQAA